MLTECGADRWCWGGFTGGQLEIYFCDYFACQFELFPVSSLVARIDVV